MEITYNDYDKIKKDEHSDGLNDEIGMIKNYREEVMDLRGCLVAEEFTVFRIHNFFFFLTFVLLTLVVWYYTFTIYYQYH